MLLPASPRLALGLALAVSSCRSESPPAAPASDPEPLVLLSAASASPSAAAPAGSAGWRAMPASSLAQAQPSRDDLPPLPPGAGLCGQGAPVRSGELGYRAPAPLQATLARLRPRWVACYNRALAGDPGLAGKVVLRFDIEADGRVCRVSDAGSTLGDPWLVECMARSSYGVQFPPSDAPFSVVYPVQLRPSS